MLITILLIFYRLNYIYKIKIKTLKLYQILDGNCGFQLIQLVKSLMVEKNI